MKANGEVVTADAILESHQLPKSKVTIEDFLTEHIQRLKDNGKVGNRYWKSRARLTPEGKRR